MGLRNFPKIRFVRDREEFFIDLCSDKVVLHLDCADAIHYEEHVNIGRHLHLLMNSTARKVYGIDFDNDAIEKLRADYNLTNLYVADVERLHLEFDDEFDVILAGELIEHLNNPGEFLNCIKKYMSSKTLLICTTPNLLSLKLFVHSIIGKQRIHPDHSLGFTYSLLQTILSRHGYFIVDWLSTVERFSSTRNCIANFLFSGIFSMFPRYADTLIVVAKHHGKGNHV